MTNTPELYLAVQGKGIGLTFVIQKEIFFGVIFQSKSGACITTFEQYNLRAGTQKDRAGQSCAYPFSVHIHNQ